jgi:hypothetical protein
MAYLHDIMLLGILAFIALIAWMNGVEYGMKLTKGEESDEYQDTETSH